MAELEVHRGRDEQAHLVQVIERKLGLGTEALAAGNLTVAEIACRDVLDLAPENERARLLLDEITSKVGTVRNVPTRPDHFLVIKSWGCGFWSDVSQLLGCFLLAEITGRTPVTDWGKGSLYGDGTESDGFVNYFQPVSEITIQEISRLDEASFFPPKWNRRNLTEKAVAKWQGAGSRLGAICFLNRPERVAVVDFFIGALHVAPWIPPDHPMHGKELLEIHRYLAERYLRPRSSISAASEDFFRAHLSGGPYVAIHLRGSDKFIEQESLSQINEMARSALSSVDSSYPIFLLTDDERILAQMKNLHGERVVATNCRRTGTSQGVHFSPTTDRIQGGVEVLVDVLLALRADRFIGNANSNVAAMIEAMKDWKPGHCTLIGPSVSHNRHLFAYTLVRTKSAPRRLHWSNPDYWRGRWRKLLGR